MPFGIVPAGDGFNIFAIGKDWTELVGNDSPNELNLSDRDFGASMKIRVPFPKLVGAMQYFIGSTDVALLVGASGSTTRGSGTVGSGTLTTSTPVKRYIRRIAPAEHPFMPGWRCVKINTVKLVKYSGKRVMASNTNIVASVGKYLKQGTGDHSTTDAGTNRMFPVTGTFGIQGLGITSIPAYAHYQYADLTLEFRGLPYEPKATPASSDSAFATFDWPSLWTWISSEAAITAFTIPGNQFRYHSSGVEIQGDQFAGTLPKIEQHSAVTVHWEAVPEEYMQTDPASYLSPYVGMLNSKQIFGSPSQTLLFVNHKVVRKFQSPWCGYQTRYYPMYDIDLEFDRFDPPRADAPAAAELDPTIGYGVPLAGHNLRPRRADGKYYPIFRTTGNVGGYQKSDLPFQAIDFGEIFGPRS